MVSDGRHSRGPQRGPATASAGVDGRSRQHVRSSAEETGWRLRRVRRFLGTTTWTGDDGGGLRHEADYLVEVEGDLDAPALEWAKHRAYGWFGRDDLARLQENRRPGEFLVHDLIARAIEERPATA